MSIPTTNIQFGDDQKFYVYRDSNNDMTIRNNEVDTLRITSQDVKINSEGGLIVCDTAELIPKAHLHIKRDDPVIIIQDLETTTNNASSIIRFADSDENSATLDINNFWDISVGITGQSDTFDFHIGKNQVWNMFTIKDDGKIGLGITSPSNKLSLYVGDYDGLSIKTKNNTNSNGIYWQHTDSYYTASINRVYNGSSSDLAFSTGLSQNNNALTEHMRITSTGNIGIGVTNPISKVQIDGQLSIPTIQLIGTARLYGNADLDNLYVPASGNIGIGITNPNVSLQIETTNAIKIPVGTTSQRPSTVQVGQIRFNSTKAHYEGYFPDSKWRNLDGLFDFDMKTKITVDENNDDRKIRFYTNDNFRMIIDQIGNIGIATNDPKVLFHIEGSDAIKIPVGTSAQRPATLQLGQIRYNSELNMYEGYGAGNAWNSLGGVIDIDQDTKITVETNQNDEDTIRFFTATTEKMMINPIGNVGIGITNPTYQLHIKDKIKASGIDIIAGTAAADANGYNFSFEAQNGGSVTSGSNTNGGDINILAGEKGTGGTSGTGLVGIIKTKGNIIPESTETFDIGSSTKKFRDIFLSEGSLWLGDECQVAISGGTNNSQNKKLSFRKRNKTVIPANIRRFLTKTGTSDKPADSDQITEFGDKTIDQVDLTELIDFMRVKTGYDNPFNDANYYHTTTGALIGLTDSTGAGKLVSDDMDTTAAWLENKGKIYYNQSGNVGIGTTDPLTKFHVVGTSTSFTNGQGNDEGIFIIPENSADGQGGGQIFFKEKDDGSEGFSIGYNGSNTDNTILGWPANTFNITRHSGNMVGNVVLTIQKDTGYVGIGSVKPEFQLEVYPDTDAITNIGKLRVGHIGITGSGGISHFDNATTTNFALRQEQLGHTFLNAPRGQKVHMSLDNIPKLTLDMDYVGIGITTPSSLFSVYGGDVPENETNTFIARFGSKIAVGKWIGIGLNTYHEDNIKNALILERKQTYGRGNLHFCLNSDDDIYSVGPIDSKMTITYDNKIGIGVSEPDYLLDLKDIPGGSTLGNIRLRSGFNASTYHLLRADNTNQHASYSIYDAYGNETVKIASGDDSFLKGGRLGIGTSTNIDASLHIYEENGAIRTSGSGSIVLEHGGSTGEKKSNIVFQSAANANDYGYIEFKDDDDSYDYWGNTTGNSSFTLGCKLHAETSSSDVVVIKGVAANIFDAENHLFLTGGVGIGVTGSVKYRLDVHTNSNDTSFANVQEQFCLAFQNVNQTNNNMTTIGNFNHLDKVNSAISFQNVNQTSNYGDIVFSTRSSDNVNDGFLTERVRITNTGKIGIGTNNPSGWITIKNVPNTNSEKLLVFSEDDTDEFYFESGFYNVGSDKETLKLKTSWEKYAMAWSGSGNVGIGVTTPEFPLEVTYSADYDYSWGMNIRNKDTTSSTTQRGNMIVFSDVNSIQAGLGAYRENFNTNRRSGLAFLVGDEPSGHVDYHTSSTTLINNSITEKMRITPDGDVGIGTTTPTSNLHIVGTTAGNNSINSNCITIENTSTTTYAEVGIRLSSFATNTNYWYSGINEGNGYAIAYGTSFTNATTILTLRDSGKVGIGTYNPDCKFHIYTGDSSGTSQSNAILTLENNVSPAIQFLGGTSSKNYIYFGDSGSNSIGRIVYDHLQNSLDFWTNSAERLTINNSGSVGIGTDSPQANVALDIDNIGTQTKAKFGHDRPIYVIAGDPHIGFNAYYDSGWKFGKGSTANSASLIGSGGDRTFILTSTNTGAADESATMAERFTIRNSTGNVGIGTSSPIYDLDINGVLGFSSSDGEKIRLTAVNTGSYIGHSSGWSIDYKAGYSGSNSQTGYHKWFTGNSNDFTERMRMTNAGNVGIGTDNPGKKFEVVGNIVSRAGSIATLMTADSGVSQGRFWHNSSYNASSPHSGWSLIFAIDTGGIHLNSGSYTGSDSRIKKDIVDVNNNDIYNKFKNIRVKNYGYTDAWRGSSPDTKVDGLIAQDLLTIFPDLVNIIPEKNINHEGSDDSDKKWTNFHEIQQNKLVYKAYTVIRVLQDKNDVLETKVSTLEQELAAIKAHLGL